MTTAALSALLLLAGPEPAALAAAQSAPVAVPAAQDPPPAARPDESAIVVTARQEVPQDPAQAINLKSYEVVSAVDDAVIGPVAKGYEKGLPGPVRSGLRNFLRNLTEPVNFVNYMLQLKPGKAVETAGRFAINSTLGVGGLGDVAKTRTFRLPYRENGFANTLGYYGIGPGPYMFLPLIGPTTLRDLVGWGLDKSFLPGLAGPPLSKPAYALASGTIKSLNDRVDFDAKLDEFRASDDPYVAEREYYLALRRAQIEALHGRGVLADGAEAPPRPH